MGLRQYFINTNYQCVNNCCTIVVTYNAMPWAEKCFGSLMRSGHPTDVIVVDNASGDETVAIIRDRFPSVELITSETNLGFGKANNLALEILYPRGYKYIFLLNQDAWVEKETIDGLIHALENNAELGIVSPVHLNGQGTGLDLKFEMYAEDSKAPGFLADYTSGDLKKSVYQTPFVNAAAWMMTHESVGAVGLFHPLFYHYGEDNNYLRRLHYQGFKLGIVANTRIYHDREDRAFNSLKDAPRNYYQRELLKEMLDPYDSKGFVSGFFLAVDQLFKRIKTVPLNEKIHFFRWALSTFFSTYQAVKAFNKEELNPFKS